MIAHGHGFVLRAFTVSGVFWGAFATLLPDVQRRSGVTDGELGLALGALAAAALPVMAVTGRSADRRGAVEVLQLCLMASALSLPLVALASDLVGLVAAVLLLGATTGALDVALSAAAAEWERAAGDGRPLMSLAHAMFSFGIVGGSCASAWWTGLGLAPLSLLLLIAAATAGTTMRVPTHRPVRRCPTDAAPSRSSPRSSSLLVIGVLVGAGFVVEDGLQTWTPLFLQRSVDAGPAVSALGVTVFAAAMGCGRLAAHVLTTRCGERRLLHGGGALAAAGIALLVTAPSAAPALAGLVLAGAGTSVLAPVLLTAVGRRAAPGRQGEDLALVNGLGYVGFIAGPPLVGAVTAVASMPVAFAVLGVTALLVGSTSPLALRTGRRAAGGGPGQDTYVEVGTGNPLNSEA